MRAILLSLCCSITALAETPRLPMSTTFQGQAKFDAVVAKARDQAAALRALPVGDRVAWFGQQLVGTPYKGFTLEIDDVIEAPSVNLNGLDCWTFFEVSLAFSRLIAHEPQHWTPAQMLRYIELDRYWGGRCDGTYLCRLHYLEDWSRDNDKRDLMDDLTAKLGGIKVTNAATEMTNNANSYRYMKNSAANRAGISKLEAGLRARPLLMIPVERVASIESELRTGDIIGIVSKVKPGTFGTSHVGLALRRDGVLRFMHASSAKDTRAVTVDSRLSTYLARLSKHAGITVTRPLR